MKKIDIRKHSYLLFGFGCGVFLVALYAIGFGGFGARNDGPIAAAQEAPFVAPVADPHVRGWAWSSNIGWISFDCRDGGDCATSNYSALIDFENDTISGYAWSSNIGWIKMNPAGSYPDQATDPDNAHGLKVDMETGELSGWMRVCSGAANMKNTPPTCDGAAVDGWDGWIKVYDAKIGDGGYIKNAAGTDGGWLWGSDVVGWIKTYDIIGATGVTFPSAACVFRATPATIIPPQTVTLEWKCNEATKANSCVIDNGGGPAVPTSGGSIVMRPTSTTPYKLVCDGFGGAIENAFPVTITKTRIIEVRPGE